MNKKKYRLPILLTAFALLLGGCGMEEQTLATVDGLDTLGNIQVVSREEGSGTRSSFAELVGFDEAGEDGKSDATTDTAVIANDADGVIERVREDASAIGYISMGSLSALEDEKVLAVDGIEGSLKNVKNGDYTISRPFILAWSGDLNDLEQDFLTYVMGKGQEIVEQSYVSVRSSTTFLSGQEEGTITVHGSSSVAPLIEDLAAEYMQLNKHAIIKVVISDSTTGLNDAMAGSCDLAMSSRSLYEYEEELLEYKEIARDGIAVIVNGENPLTDVSTDELNQIFTGTITKWDEINEGRGNNK